MGRKISEKTKQKGRYFVFGVLNTVINFAMYEALALTLFKDDKLWIATLISGAISIFVGYYLHSRFTWKDRKVGKKQLGKFFIWNVVMNIAVRPLLTMFFGLFGFLYKIAFDICQGIGNYVLMTAVVMVINFLVYDRFVFGESKHEKKNATEKDDESDADTED